jgi:hypothetical protein
MKIDHQKQGTLNSQFRRQFDRFNLVHPACATDQSRFTIAAGERGGDRTSSRWTPGHDAWRSTPGRVGGGAAFNLNDEQRIARPNLVSIRKDNLLRLLLAIYDRSAATPRILQEAGRNVGTQSEMHTREGAILGTDKIRPRGPADLQNLMRPQQGFSPSLRAVQYF